MKTLTKYSLVCALAVASPLTMADTSEKGVYAGFGYGTVKAKDSEEFNDDSDAYQVIVGGQLAKMLAVEGSYIDFGEYGGNLASADVDGFTLALKLVAPIADRFSMHVEGGQLWWDADFEVLNYDGSTDGSELFWGVGAAFAVTSNVDVLLDYTRYNVEFEEEEVGLLADDSLKLDTDVDHASLGVRYHF